MNSNNTRQMLRTPEAAQYLGISASTMNKLRVYGDGPAFVKLGRTVVYDPVDLNDWLRTNRRTSTSVAA
ncbi:transcriptional regulator, AlpA family [Aquamicrobium aerolatum DSM 21857]|uniref:Transcriptional regulator, AlpA family n=2 Tax=Aerobium TaxID=3143707 RepID=A0A1I3SVT3_9HYPH|nr:transcriptional regulator, AlpA family [Aquamicrobium aerolatum DSM 21857]